MATQNNPLAPPDTPDTHIRVLIADDHAVVREGLVAMIDRQPDMRVVAAGARRRGSRRRWSEQRPDITLVDLRMPRLDGVGFISQVRALDPKARIIILTTFDGDEDIYRGMRAGAKAYLLKDAPRDNCSIASARCTQAIHSCRRTWRPSSPRKCRKSA